MKRYLLALMVGTILCAGSFAQNRDYIRPTSVGVSFFFNDYATAQRIRTTSLSNVMANKQWAKFREMSPGLALTYFKGLTNQIDFAGTIAGSFSRVPIAGKEEISQERFLVEADASVNLKMFSDKYIFTPYLIAGVGASIYEGELGAFVPLGGGLKVNLFDEAAIFVTSQYRVPVSLETNAYHFMNSIGIAGVIGNRKGQTEKAEGIQ